ncbi:MAG: class I SAM-dependent methyltransferase [Reichenbachiella sp.]
MNDSDIQDIPKFYDQLLIRCDEIGFSMPSDMYIGPFLKTLVASKPSGHFLELGTGMSLSLAWMIDGMDKNSEITSVDYDQQLVDIAKEYFSKDTRVEIVCQDGSQWVNRNLNKRYDLIFADTWAGKYTELDEVLNMLNVGGIYVIDDMNEQSNWPEGHAEKAKRLIQNLEKRKDFNLVKMNWSTGVILATKIN